MAHIQNLLQIFDFIHTNRTCLEYVINIVYNRYTGIVLRVRPLTDSVRGPGKQRLPPNHKSWRRTAGINEDQRKTFYKTCYPFRDLSRLHHPPVKFLFRKLLPLQIFQPDLKEIRQTSTFQSVMDALSLAFRSSFKISFRNGFSSMIP